MSAPARRHRYANDKKWRFAIVLIGGELKRIRRGRLA